LPLLRKGKQAILDPTMSFNLKHKLISQYSKFISPQKVILISGSVGKTSTLLACESALSQNGPVLSITDSILDKPEALLKITPAVKKVLLEAKIENPEGGKKLVDLVHPEVLIITNVLEDQNQLSVEQQLEEYSVLLEKLPPQGAVILNWDDPHSRKLADKTPAEVIFIGTDQKYCHLWAGNIQISKFRVIFELNYGVERVEIETNFITKPQIYSLLMAAALGLKTGLRLTQLKVQLEQVFPQDHLLNIVSGFNGSTVIDGSGDGAVITTIGAIESLNFVSARRRVVVLGPMRGINLEKQYRQIARKIYQDKIDLVLLGKGEVQTVGDELLKLGFIAERLEQDLTNPQIVGNLLKVLGKGDVVLVKGAKEVRLDEVVTKISKLKV